MNTLPIQPGSGFFSSITSGMHQVPRILAGAGIVLGGVGLALGLLGGATTMVVMSAAVLVLGALSWALDVSVRHAREMGDLTDVAAAEQAEAAEVTDALRDVEDELQKEVEAIKAENLHLTTVNDSLTTKVAQLEGLAESQAKALEELKEAVSAVDHDEEQEDQEIREVRDLTADLARLQKQGRDDGMHLASDIATMVKEDQKEAAVVQGMRAVLSELKDSVHGIDGRLGKGHSKGLTQKLVESENRLKMVSQERDNLVDGLSKAKHEVEALLQTVTRQTEALLKTALQLQQRASVPAGGDA